MATAKTGESLRVGSRGGAQGEDLHLRLDLGKLMYGQPNEFFVGTEYQFWVNKLRDQATDESAFQVLAVWRF